MKMLTFALYALGGGRSGGECVREPSGMKVYVRRSLCVKGAFELANINVPEPKQGRGILTRFLEEHATMSLKIENVVNNELAVWLRRQSDWKVEEGDADTPSFLNTMYVRSLAKEETR